MDNQAIETLSALLKGELSAVVSYDEALKSVRDENCKQVLESCKDSHCRRSDKLKQALTDLGGTAVDDAGSWGSLARLITRGAGAAGESSVLMALEEGEDMGSSDYEWRLLNMHTSYRDLVKKELWPEQQKTQKRLSELVSGLSKNVWPPSPEPEEV